MSRRTLLEDLSSALGRQIDLDALVGAAAARIAEALDAERATIWISSPEEGGLVTQVATLPEVDRLVQPLGQGISGIVAQTGESLLIPDARHDPRFDSRADEETGFSTRNMIAVPIVDEGSRAIRGVLQVLNKRDDAFSESDLCYVTALGAQLAQVFSLTSLRAERHTLPGLTVRGKFNRIIGRSPAMDEVYRRVSLAAETDATVLFLGETGTGKGLLARAVHDNSARQAGPFITVDATTLPAQLVESELFGHERGAFTGADRRVIGKIERAHQGTLFIDEIGELRLESQGKLLRFLQERKFERVGGHETITTDCRVVCATHRNLEQLASEGSFRRDLLYRIKVVEIDVPPLRHRGAEELQLLAAHFGRMYAERYARPKPVWSLEVLASLSKHSWAGNVRELEHWVESAVVLHPDGKLAPMTSSEHRSAAGAHDSTDAALPLGLDLDEAMRNYAERTLDSCAGNKAETARRLGISRNRLTRLLDGQK